MYPYVSLQDFPLNEQLVRRLPRQLAYYHLAVPIGIDDEGITVAMAQPDNANAQTIIQHALKQHLRLVQADANTIQSALDQIWINPAVQTWRRIAPSPDLLSQHYAHLFAEVYLSGLTERDSALQSDSELLVLTMADNILDKQSSLFVKRKTDAIPHILQIIRLHTPDAQLFDTLLPLVRHQQAYLSFMVDTSTVNHDLAQLLDTTSQAGKHLSALRNRAEQAGIQGELLLPQQALIDAIHTHLQHQPDTLVAIAADAYGDFVQSIHVSLRQLDFLALLILKPFTS